MWLVERCHPQLEFLLDWASGLQTLFSSEGEACWAAGPCSGRQARGGFFAPLSEEESGRGWNTSKGLDNGKISQANRLEKIQG